MVPMYKVTTVHLFHIMKSHQKFEFPTARKGLKEGQNLSYVSTPVLRKELKWSWLDPFLKNVKTNTNKLHTTYHNLRTVFPHIVAAATILFWKLECGNYSKEETIQGRKLLIY